MFAIIFFRLWYLQVLSGDTYLHEASFNSTRGVAIPAQRGEILDRNGIELVGSKQATVVEIALPQLPKHAEGMLHRLSGVLGLSTRPGPCKGTGHGVPLLTPIDCMIAKGRYNLPYANVTIAQDVPRDVLYYLSERAHQFPGVLEQQVFIRDYPSDTLAAQLLGTVGPITKNELAYSHYNGVPHSAIVGQSGVEYSYDHYLRGRDGAYQIQVDSQGSPIRTLPQQLRPRSGNNLELSVDMKLQKAGEAALALAISNNYPAPAGAFVALNPDNGEVLAMGSNPTYSPSLFAQPVIPQAKYDQVTGQGSGHPLDNRAIAGLYPTGSTFKPITAIAALQSGTWSAGATYDDTGTYQINAQTLHNAGGAAYGSLDLVNAIRVSSDIFFYHLGALMNVEPSKAPNGGALQTYARLLGIGQPTGVDVGGEPAPDGILPTPNWRAKNNVRELGYEHAHHVSCCTLGDLRPWSIGDNIHLAVGQGDLEATPLQLAVAYSAIENGGNVVRPHVGLNVQAADGTILQKIEPPPTRHVQVDQANLDEVKSGLRAAASLSGGTSAAVFGNFPAPVYGKTGTAQHNNQQDQAWYACFVPAYRGHPPIVVVVTVEQGGFGAVAAAPAARQILSYYYFHNRGPWVAGTSRTL
jgi:penicillin-binding protein 2